VTQSRFGRRRCQANQVNAACTRVSQRNVRYRFVMQSKEQYVDGFVVPVPKENVEAYRKMSLLCAEVWKEYGAISYVE